MSTITFICPSCQCESEHDYHVTIGSPDNILIDKIYCPVCDEPFIVYHTVVQSLLSNPVVQPIGAQTAPTADAH